MNKKFNPLVSIIIPVYNGSNYMREAIDSAIAQTYKNIEIIVVNDGSIDNTEEIAKSYGNKIKYYKKENGGVATALNLAIKKSKGKYISWLSHDDLYYPDKIEKQINKLRALNVRERKNTIIWSNYSLINEKTEITFIKEFESLHEFKKLNHPMYPLVKGMIHGCTLLIPKYCYDKIGYFNETLKTTQDYDLWLRMFPKCGLLFISDVLVKSRWHDEQGSKTIKNTTEEVSSLWIQMIDSLTKNDKIFISGNEIKFYEETLKIMLDAKYTEVVKYLEKKIYHHRNADIINIKVSVIIPFFNRIDWTIEAIESVINQTHKNLEIFVINDYSSEDVTKIKNICDKYVYVKFIKNKRTKGASGARNTGIELATGEFIAFLDSDDFFNEKKIEKQLKFMIRTDSLFCHTSYILFKDDIFKKMNSGLVNYNFPSIISGCSIATPTVMIATILLKKNNLRFPELFFGGEDVCFWTDISKFVTCIGFNEVLSNVRNHGKNHAYNHYKQIQGLSNILNYVSSNYLIEENLQDILQLNKKITYKINEINNEIEIKKQNSKEMIKGDMKNVHNIQIVEEKLNETKEEIIKEIPKSKPQKFSKMKHKIRKTLHKLIWTVSPLFRMQTGNKQRTGKILARVYDILEKNKNLENKIEEKNKNLENKIEEKNKALEFVIDNKSDYLLANISNKINLLENKIEEKNKAIDNKSDYLLSSIDNKINSLENKIEEKNKVLEFAINNKIKNLKNDFELEKNNIYVNLIGEPFYIEEDHKSKMIKYNCDIFEFFEKMKKFILRTEIVMDVGPGIRPQTFFTPKVHICVEPFKQYRDVVKPLFPNKSHFLFIKKDGVEAMKDFDDNSVDSVFMLDLIEHLEKEDGIKLLQEAERIAKKQIIVFTPLGFYPMHFKEKGQKDAWGLDGTDVQEHKSGWLPGDFGESWDFHICIDCHEAFLPEEKKQGKKYSALMAIKTKKFHGFPILEETPAFVKETYNQRILQKN